MNRFFLQVKVGIRDIGVTGVSTCALPILADRGMDMEAQILEIIRDMLSSPYSEQRLPLKDITSWFVDRHGMDYERKVTRSEERRVGKEGRSRWSPYH